VRVAQEAEAGQVDVYGFPVQQLVLFAYITAVS
jgi:hypothetical protein